MTETAPLYIQIIVWLMMGTTVAGVAVMVIGFPIFIWYQWKQHKREQEGGEGEGGDGGGGGWTDKPSGKPPGGGGPDIDKQFHAVADAIAKSIKIDENRKEKVLT